MKIKYLDLFSGIAGFALGIQQSGVEFEEHYFSEVDKYATQIYKKHFPTAIGLGSVTDVRGKELPKFGLITFGFPCQDLSIAGKRAGLEGSRSGLFGEAIRIINENKPDYFILENVKGLLSADKGKAIEIVVDTIAKMGYNVDIGLMNTSWYLPQNRERIYGIGVNWLCLMQELTKNGTSQKSIFSESIIGGYLLRKYLLELDEVKSRQQIGYIDLDLTSEVEKELVLSGQVLKKEYLKIMQEWGLESLIDFCQDILGYLSKLKNTNLDMLSREYHDIIHLDTKLDTQEKMVKKDLYLFIEKLLNSLSTEDYYQVNKFIILTWIKEITTKKIFSYATIEALTQSYITTLKLCSPSYTKKVMLNLTKRMEDMNYAKNRRSQNKNSTEMLFDEFSVSRTTRITLETLGHIRGQRRPKVFPICQDDGIFTVKGRANQRRAQTEVSHTLRGENVKADHTFIVENKLKQIGTIGKDSEATRVYNPEGIARTIKNGGGMGAKTGLYAIPVLTPNRIKKRQNGRRFKNPGDDSFTLTGQDCHGVMYQICEERKDEGLRFSNDGNCGSLRTISDCGDKRVINNKDNTIRRLTPTEAERLQGFPDGWSKCGNDGKEISDSQRYKCLGNAVSVPVVKAVIERLKEHISMTGKGD